VALLAKGAATALGSILLQCDNAEWQLYAYLVCNQGMPPVLPLVAIAAVVLRVL
jgi:hypothetical protein